MKLSHECAGSPRPSCMQSVARSAHGFNQAVMLRGFERLATDMYELLSDDFPVTLVRGGGPAKPGELRLRVPRRNEQPLVSLGGGRGPARGR